MTVTLSYPFENESQQNIRSLKFTNIRSEKAKAIIKDPKMFFF